ncbi:hypothetical protein [Gynuella sp.]|uniref:hypothetical protein n=1 Tax=Gynuella sp. TaxID=2969146 RepID=UPI003D129BD8
MKNIQIIDGAENCVYDIFSATEKEFDLIFPKGSDIAFIDEVYEKESESILNPVFTEIWKRRVPKVEVRGIHGTLFYDLEYKKNTTLIAQTRAHAIQMARSCVASSY